MARNLFKAARKDISAFRKASALDLTGDYVATQSQIDAIYRNLGTATAGLGANLTSMQARQLAALQRISGKGTSAAARVNARAARQAVNRYGTAMGPVAQTALGPAKAAAAATGVIAKGQVKAGSMLARAGQTALATQQSATAEAQAAAQYATAVALKSRGQQDAAQVAAMQFDLEKMRLDNHYAMQQMERESELQLQNQLALMKAERANQDPEVHANLVRIQDLGANSFTTLQKLFNTQQEDGSYPDATQAATAYAASLGYAPGTDQFMVIQSVANAMYRAGAGPTNVGDAPLGAGGLYGPGASSGARQALVMDAVNETLISLYPDYADELSSTYDSLKSRTASQYTLSALRAAQEPGGDTPNTPDPGEVAWDDAGFWDKFKYTMTHPWDMTHPKYFTPPGDLDTAIFAVSLGLGPAAKGSTALAKGLSTAEAATGATRAEALANAGTRGSGTFANIIASSTTEDILSVVVRARGQEAAAEALKLISQGKSKWDVLAHFGIIPG
jgi:hypothetical protein